MLDACKDENNFQFLYPARNEVARPSGADRQSRLRSGWRGLGAGGGSQGKQFESDPKFADYATMMVKTHLSLSHEPTLKGVPKGWTLPIRDVLVYSGAKFLCPCAGTISLMPGTSSNPGLPQRGCGCEDRKSVRTILMQGRHLWPPWGSRRGLPRSPEPSKEAI